ncbi:hypothetical protein MKX03_002727, partial [Papaver bracteatum]
MSLLLFVCTCLFLFSKSSVANDTMVPNEYLSVNKTLVSSGQTFELGFFSTNNTKNLYLGIWYKNITPMVVLWVANRNHPLTDSTGGLTIAGNGNIVVLSGSKSVIWSSNLSRLVGSPVVQLLENGNLILKDGLHHDSVSYIWQSFDYPTNNRLPEMKLGWDLKIGLDRYFTSWKNSNDPSIGDFSYGMDLTGIPQFVVRNGSVKQFRSGVWNGVKFSGLVNFRRIDIFRNTDVVNTDEATTTFTNRGSDSSVITRELLDERGTLQRFRWDKQTMKWSEMMVIPRDKCDNYNYCGVNGICNIAISPPCDCLRGFTPISQQQWSINNWTDGCVRKTSLECGSDIFVPIEGLKLPDMINFSVNKSTNLAECNLECMRNCSCTAYANSDIRDGGSGCILWFGDLFDFRHFSDTPGNQHLYLRLASSEEETMFQNTQKKKSQVLLKVILSVGLSVLLFCLVILLIIWKTKRRNGVLNADERKTEDLNLPLFDLISIEIATNNFSHTNKIGEGGYGPVYKGKTSEGQEIAVKRLSKDSGQGNTEFKNEASQNSNVMYVTSSYTCLFTMCNLKLHLHSNKKSQNNNVLYVTSSYTCLLQCALAWGALGARRWAWLLALPSAFYKIAMNTRLPGMKPGWDLKIGLNRYFTSWKNVNDPSVGDYTYGMELTGLPQLVVWNGSVKKFRSGVWNGFQFDGIPNLRPNEIFSYDMVINTTEVYATFTNKGSDPSVITRESMNEEGVLQRFIWDKQSMKWSDMVVFPRNKCDNYNHCGVNGICNIARSPPCECFRGFKPISQQQWSIENWTDGCVRNTSLECESDIFKPIKGIKMPDMVNFLVNKSMSIEECEWECMRNCSCTAYANSDIREGGSGCIFWYGDLLDSRSFSDAGEQRLFLRLALSEAEPPVSEGKTINKAMKEKSRVLMKVLLSV